MAVRMNSFHTLTVATCIIMSFMTLFSGVKIHGATTTPNVACIVASTNLITISGTLFSAGSNGTGPYIYNDSEIFYGVSNIGSFNQTSSDTATIASDLITSTITNGRGNWTNINGTANDALYFSYTGVANSATHTFQLYAIMTGGSGKYSGAVGSGFVNGTVYFQPVNNGLALAGTGSSITVVATALLP